MVTCTCMVQAGQNPARRKAQLTQALEGFSQRAFGTAAQIGWITVEPGAAFTACEASTSSIVSFAAAEPLEQAHRAALLGELCELWSETTGCSTHEVVAVISDPARTEA